MVSYLKLLFLPFSLLYWGITAFRNLLFSAGVFKQNEFLMPVISVGNITVGGTGKTPHIEMFLRFLQDDQFNIATLSRGYKRSTKGFLLYDQSYTAREIGDEPAQIAQKFPEVRVAVCEERVLGIKKLQSLFSDIDCILLDDAYQHRHVLPSLSVLLVDYNRPIWNDFVFPAGMMREGFYARSRADIIILSKCPEDFSIEDAEQCLRKLKPTQHQRVYFTTVSYNAPVYIQKGKILVQDNAPAIVVTGIAQHKPFCTFIEQSYSIENSYHFPDHHAFSDEELRTVFIEAQKNVRTVITTEKDAKRIEGRAILSDFPDVPVVYFPISTQVLFDKKEELKGEILNHIKTFKS